ncbi:S-layer homology domain-containing protein [Candidatus Saccharibacteria bacterium]|nr:S-layer homology domain-containing protein [Candidatus Saccharibacteria bacterium]
MIFRKSDKFCVFAIIRIFMIIFSSIVLGFSVFVSAATQDYTTRLTIEVVDPASPVNPDDPVNPDNPTSPDDPTDPDEPVNPVNPDDPTDPDEPINPDGPIDPTNPDDPVDPTNPISPDDPVNPDDPVVSPTDSEEPVNPEELTDSSDENVLTPNTGVNTDLVEAKKTYLYVFLVQLLLTVLYIIFWRRKKTKLYFSSESKISAKILNLVVVLLFVATDAVILMTATKEAKVFADFSSSNTVIDMPGQIHMVAERGGEIAMADDTIALRTNARSFKLYAYVKSSNRIINNSGNYINPISNNGSIFDENVWGYRIGGNSNNYSSLPVVGSNSLNGKYLYGKTFTGNGDRQDSIDVTYGMKANTELEVGTYEGIINYVVITDVSRNGSAQILSPTTTVSGDGGTRMNILTSLQEYGEMNLGNPRVLVGDNNCTDARIQKDNNTNFLSITCILPENNPGNYDVYIAIPRLDWEFSIMDGISVIDNNIRTISVGNESCNLYINNTHKARENSICLQSMIDEAHDIAVRNNNIQQTVIVPRGAYYFAWTGMRTKEQNGALVYDTSLGEYYCIKLKSYVKIVGEGNSRVIRSDINPDNFAIFYPYDGTEFYGDSSLPSAANSRVDMFYFNDYADSSFDNKNYLVNADFSNFVVDGRYTTASNLNSSAGKGFMVNLFRDCDWDNVAVLNTDGTGFGMDCPIRSTISNSLAVGCGKGPGIAGHSGFGIGTGYVNNENLSISNSYAYYNSQYGFFFEHQGKWFNQGSSYPAKIIGNTSEFIVRNSFAGLNAYDYGGERAYNVSYLGNRSNETANYRQYVSTSSLRRSHALAPVFFGDLSTNIFVTNQTVERSDYDDVDGSAMGIVKWATGEGIIAPNSAMQFGKNDNISRGEALSMLWRYFNHTNESLNDGRSYLYYNNPMVYYREPIADFGNRNYKSIPKVDHSNSTDIYIATDWALDSNITNGSGYSSGGLELDLNDNCSRVDFMIYLYRLSGENVSDMVSGNLDDYLTTFFDDVASIRSFRGDIGINAVSWGAYRGIINNNNSRMFVPGNTIIKMDAVNMLYEYDNNSDINIKP